MIRVAVISPEQASGKSTLMALLSGVFSRSQNKNVAIMSTGRATENIDIVNVVDNNQKLRSVHVFKALLSSDAIETKELFDYGYRAGEENVFIYDIFGVAMDVSEQQSLFMETLQNVPADLTLVEIKGDLYEEFNQRVLKACDAILYLFTTSKPSISKMRDYIDNGLQEFTVKTGYVCSRYDRNIIGEKKLGQLCKMNARNILLFPYNSAVGKKSLDGTVDYLVYDIMKGHPEVLELRSRLLEIMQYLFDTDKHKYIRGVADWFK